MVDTVEPHNIANQVPGRYYLGKPKVDAMVDLIPRLVHDQVEIEVEKRFFTDSDEITGTIVVAALDSIKARKLVFEMTKNNMLTEMFVDFRIGGRLIKGYILNPQDLDDCDIYEVSLHDKNVAAETNCTEKMCIQSVLWTAGEVADAAIVWSKGKLSSYKVVHDYATKMGSRKSFNSCIN